MQDGGAESSGGNNAGCPAGGPAGGPAEGGGSRSGKGGMVAGLGKDWVAGVGAKEAALGAGSALAKVRLVGKEMLVKDSSGARCVVLGATAKDMVRGAAKHATSKSDWVSTLEVGEWIGGIFRSCTSGRVSLHRSFSRGKEHASGSGDVVGW